MDQIRLLSANIPNNLRDAVKILMTGADFEMEDMLPIPLGAIQDTADKCFALAVAVENKFDFVMGLTAELLEACVSTQGKYEEELREVKIAREIAEENKKSAEEQKQLATEMYDEIKNSVQKAEKSYYDALDSMPSGWDMIGKNVVEGIATTFTGFLDAVSFKWARPGKKGSKSSKHSTEAQNPSGTSADRRTLEAYGLAPLLQTYTTALASTALSNDGMLTPLAGDLKQVEYCKQQYQNTLKKANVISKNAVSERIADLCNTGIKLCKGLKENAKSFEKDDQRCSSMAKNLLKLQADVMTIASESKNVMGTNPTDSRAPTLSAMPPEVDPNATAAQIEVQNVRYKMQQTSAQLDSTREMYDKSCDRMMEASQKLGEIIADIKKLNIQEINFEQIRETLMKGIRALGELREQWDKLVSFFQMMSSIIKCCLNTSLKGFLEYAATSQTHSLKGYPITSLKKDMIYQQAFQANKIAHVVNMIATSYVEVSTKHLTHRIAGLGGMMGLNPEKDAHEIELKRQELLNGCQDAQEDIRNLVKKRKNAFDRQVTSRIQAIEKELMNALPPVDPADKSLARIQEAVAKGTRNAKAIEPPKRELDIEDFV